MNKIDIISNWIQSCKTVEQLQNINRFVHQHPQFSLDEKCILLTHIINILNIKF